MPNRFCPTCRFGAFCSHLCPAINYALTGDIFTVDERTCRFIAITQQVVQIIYKNIGQEPVFREYLLSLRQRLEHRYPILKPLSIAELDRLADRADSIIKRLR
jgi:hypothetical protein